MTEKTTYEIGEEFERHVLNYFPDEHFSIVWATPRKSDLNGRKMELSRYPDYIFRCRKTNHQFWVECKYRSEMNNGRLYWCEAWRYEKYQEIRKESDMDLFVMIGIGRSPDEPKDVLCIDIDNTKRYITEVDRVIFSIYGSNFASIEDIYFHTSAIEEQ